jgi:hypothetical protein
MNEVATSRRALRETLLALLVLSLTFLNFGHQSLVFASGGQRVVVTGWSICGDQGPAAPGDHFACHACRQDLPALPPPPASVLPVRFATAIAYAPLFLPLPPLLRTEPGNARAPPSI